MEWKQNHENSLHKIQKNVRKFKRIQSNPKEFKEIDKNSRYVMRKNLSALRRILKNLS